MYNECLSKFPEREMKSMDRVKKEVMFLFSLKNPIVQVESDEYYRKFLLKLFLRVRKYDTHKRSHLR